jgi:trimeric autotransporter adhesin
LLFQKGAFIKPITQREGLIMSDFSIAVAPCNLLMPPSGSEIIAVSNPEITIPPPPSGGSTFVLNLSALDTPSVTAPANASWSPSPTPTLTVDSSFQDGIVTIAWDGGSTTLNIVVNGTSAAVATETHLTVNVDGSFIVTGLAEGVTLTDGVTSLVTSIPSGGQVQVSNPVFFVTDTSNSFSVTGATSSVTLGTITAGAGLSVSGASVSVGPWTSLSNSLVTVPFNTGSTSFMVVQSNRSPGAGGTTGIAVQADGSFLVTSLSPDTYLTGIGLQYQTTATGEYGFTFGSAGVDFNGNMNITFSGDGQQPEFITALSQSSSSTSFTDANTTGATNSVTFTIDTNEGVLDPTILNNPDPS